MNHLVVAVFVLLLPGLISTIIADKICVHAQPWSSFKYTIYSFVFGVFSYILLQLIISSFGLFPSPINFLPDLAGELSVWSFASSDTFEVDLREVFAAALLSPVVGFAIAWVYNQKFLNEMAHNLGISRKYGDENLFSYFLNSPAIDWVYVRDAEREVMYRGRVHAFSERENIQEIVLFNVTVYGYNSGEESYSVDNIYISREAGKIEFEAPRTAPAGAPEASE